MDKIEAYSGTDRSLDAGVCRSKLASAIADAVELSNKDELLNCYNQEIGGSEADKKMTLDQAFRDAIKGNIGNIDLCLRIIDFCIELVKDGMTSTSAIFAIIADALDLLPLEHCEKVFTYIESNVAVWKQDHLYSAGKTYLLRMCNDLLRRLSESQQTVICGRIQMFLARLFPLSEKSALNLMSHFNVDNRTVFSNKEEVIQNHLREEGIEEGELTKIAPPVDYDLYRKFWTLQDYFRLPTQCYEKAAWRRFTRYSDDVLTVFASYKVDVSQSSRKRKHSVTQDDVTNREMTSSDEVCFTKFLTNEKLLDLQMSDPNFRRHILLQMLFLFQYLGGNVKFKLANQVLSDDQTGWITSTETRVYSMLRDTPPDGPQFAATVDQLLNRETNWIGWKNEGCASYTRPPRAESRVKLRIRRASIADDEVPTHHSHDLGSAELTRLWNIAPDNMQSCKLPERRLQPTLEAFFESPVQQLNPNCGIEDEYKATHQPNHQWRALRLLSRKAPFFFHPTTQAFANMSQYMEYMCRKLAKEYPNLGKQLEGGGSAVGSNGGGSNAVSDSEGSESEFEDTETMVTAKQLENLAGKLTPPEWKKLAIQLDFKDMDIQELADSYEEPLTQARKMLASWFTNNGTNATLKSLTTALTDVGLSNYL